MSSSSPTPTRSGSGSVPPDGARVTASPGLGWRDRRLLFFTGKGGVGKSTIAAATAVHAAANGKRVLLVEVDDKGNAAALFEHPPIGFDPVEVHPGVQVVQNAGTPRLRTTQTFSSYQRFTTGGRIVR